MEIIWLGGKSFSIWKVYYSHYTRYILDVKTGGVAVPHLSEY